jgi:hypothetical protein
VKWHVTVAVGNTAESSATDTFLRQLPQYTLPVFVGYRSDLRLSNIRLTIGPLRRMTPPSKLWRPLAARVPPSVGPKSPQSEELSHLFIRSRLTGRKNSKTCGLAMTCQ